MRIQISVLNKTTLNKKNVNPQGSYFSGLRKSHDISMIFPGFPGVLSFFQVFQVEWEPWSTINY